MISISVQPTSRSIIRRLSKTTEQHTTFISRIETGCGHRAAASGVRSLPRAVRQASRGQRPQATGHRYSSGGKRMTTHDYQGETNPSLTRVDPATASDPGWQRQADEFAADRGERTSTYRTFQD